MIRRHAFFTVASIAAVAAALAIPSLALAGNPATSPVDSSAASVASGDSAPTSSSSDSAPSKTSVDSSDSPTAKTYEVPPTDPCAPTPDSSGKTPVAPTTCSDTPTPPTTQATPVSGGGDAPAIDAPEPVDVVSGGGEDPVAAPDVVSGGGGPELPFTGLPLIYAIYAGLGLTLLGVALWYRARKTS